MFSVLQINGYSSDDQDMSALSEEDLFIAQVNSVEEARAGLQSDAYDCIICHDQDTGTDGLELLRNLRMAGDSTPFIFVTGKEDETMVRSALQLGAHDVLPANSLSPEALKLQLRKLREANGTSRSENADSLPASEQLLRLGERTRILERKEQEYDRLLQLMTTEFREELNSIDEFSLLLKEDLDELSAGDVRRYLDLIHRSSSRIKTTMDMLQNYRKAQLTKLQLRQVNISVIAASIIEDLAASQPGRTTRTCVASDLKAYADESLVHLCFEYLIRTAWESTLRKGHTELTFGCYRKDDERIFFLSNNGEALSQEQRRKAYEAFEDSQLTLLHSNEMRDKNAYELGLTIVERIISRHGGKLWFEDADNGSTTYLFTLG